MPRPQRTTAGYMANYTGRGGRGWFDEEGKELVENPNYKSNRDWESEREQAISSIKKDPKLSEEEKKRQIKQTIKDSKFYEKAENPDNRYVVGGGKNWFTRIFNPPSQKAISANDELLRAKNLGLLSNEQAAAAERERQRIEEEAKRSEERRINENLAAAMIARQQDRFSRGDRGPGAANPITTAGTNDLERIGNFYRYVYGDILNRGRGASAIDESEADIAQAAAQATAFENARLADLARRANIAATATAMSNLDLRNAQIREAYGRNPSYAQQLQYKIGHDLVPDIEVSPGQMRFDLLNNKIYEGSRQEMTEKQEMIPFEIGGKTQMLPGDTVRSSRYIPGKAYQNPIIGRIDNPNPNPPRIPKTAAESVAEDSGYYSTEEIPLTLEELQRLQRQRYRR